MRTEEILIHLKKHKIVPVVKLERAADAAPLAEALCMGGLPVAEITFRTEQAEESIRMIKRLYPHVLVGAGTVVNEEQAKRAVYAGAEFLVSPGMDRKVIECAQREGISVLPGACTPTEIIAAMECGLSVVKFFPAGQYGGLATIKALSAPFPGMLFLPTGGISEANVLDYLRFPRVIACGGSWMVKDSLIEEGDFAQIVSLTRRAVELAGSV